MPVGTIAVPLAVQKAVQKAAHPTKQAGPHPIRTKRRQWGGQLSSMHPCKPSYLL
jgi:hypothetical protein